jgi:serine/threonine-protein kinase
VSRQGLEQPISDAPRRYAYPRLAREGRRIVVYADGDLWVQDTVRPTLTRLTSAGTGGSFHVLTPDGKRVVFRSRTGMRWIDLEGSGQSQAISGSTSLTDLPSSVSPDGETLAFLRQSADSSADVYVLDLHGESEARAVVNTPAYEGGAQFSPDGRWMAYVSDESGQMQVYVRPYPGPDRQVPVSTQGGTQPVWNRNGRELFYRNMNKMMVVDVTTSPGLVLSQPRQLFDQRYAFLMRTQTNYDVSADGQRFVMVKDESGSGRLNVVQNWLEDLKRLVPPN